MAGHRLQLLADEKVLVDIRPHWSYLSGPLVVAAVTIAVGVALDIGYPHTSVAVHWVEGLVVAVPCLWLAVRTARWWTTSLILTTLRLVEMWGVASAQHSETPLDSVVAVTAVQSLGRRVLGTGCLELEIRGERRVRRIDDVRKPVILQRIITRRLRPYAEGPDDFG